MPWLRVHHPPRRPAVTYLPMSLPLPVPKQLSPSALTLWDRCRLAFRYRTIDRLPEPPGTGNLVGLATHAALDGLMQLPVQDRTLPVAHELAASTWRSYNGTLWALAVSREERARLRAELAAAVERYFAVEDPTTVDVVATEHRMKAEVDGRTLTGVLDRIDRTPDGLAVVDYKVTRRPHPSYSWREGRQVALYGLLWQATAGESPAQGRLLHLVDGVVTRWKLHEGLYGAVRTELANAWRSLERACESGEFPAQKGPHCDWCGFQACCPAWGGTVLPFGGTPEEVRA